MKKTKFILIPTLVAVIAVMAVLIGNYSGITNQSDKTAKGNAVGMITSALAEADYPDPEVIAIEEKVVAYDNSGKEIDIEQVDESTYDGFIFSADGDVKTSDAVRYIGGNTYAADSIEDMSEAVDSDTVTYVEPNYEFSLMDDSQAFAETVDVLDPVDPPAGDDFDFDLLGGWSSSPNDSYVSKQYCINLQNEKGAWKNGVYGADSKVVVSVIDSGLYTNQEDIDYSHIVKGKSYIGGSSTQDGYSHGTMVTGVIMASQNNRRGVAGAAPGVYVMPMKVFDSNGKCNGEGIFKAIYDSIDAGVEVINMSLGTTNYSYSFKQACEAASKAGIIVIAAAGNNGNSVVEYPAAFDCVIGVASVGPDGTRSSFSEIGESVDVAAAGENVYGLYNSEKTPYCICNGTSFACPQVAALAAMVKSIDSSYTTDKFFSLLKKTSSNYTESGGAKWNKNTGYGIVNFGKVIDEVRATYVDMDETTVTVDTPSVPYDGSEKEVSVTCTYKGKTLKKGTDYTTVYLNNIDVGTANVILKGKGKYTGSTYASFEIYDPYVEETASIGPDGVATVSDSLASKLKPGYIGKVVIPSDDINVKLTKSFIKKIAPYGVKFEAYYSSVELGTDSLNELASKMKADEVYLKLIDGELVYEDGLPLTSVGDDAAPAVNTLSVNTKIGLQVPSELSSKVVCAVDKNKKPYYGKKISGILTFEAPAGAYTVTSADPFVKTAAGKVTPKASLSASGSKLKIKTTASVSSITKMGYAVQYKYYVSTSKSSGYKCVKTTSSKSYTYSAKKGKTYYVKVQAVALDRDGKTIAKSKESAVASKKL